MPTKFRVEITRTAEQDLQSIFEYLSKESRQAASRWLAEIERQITTLERFPKRCPIIPESEELEYEYRHLIFGDYRTLFRIEGKRVVILRIIHGAQLLRLVLNCHNTRNVIPAVPKRESIDFAGYPLSRV